MALCEYVGASFINTAFLSEWIDVCVIQDQMPGTDFIHTKDHGEDAD
jgi:hypothetical protein